MCVYQGGVCVGLCSLSYHHHQQEKKEERWRTEEEERGDGGGGRSKRWNEDGGRGGITRKGEKEG